MKRKKIKFPFKIIIITVLVLTALYFSIHRLSHLLLVSEYFNIKEVITNNEDVDLSYLKGSNIFSVNFKKVSRKLNSSYPEYRMITLLRNLPNCIIVDFKKRVPLAYVKLYRFFAVDEEAVLFNTDEIRADLPIIFGLQTKIFGPKSGQKHQVKELNLALDLIKTMSKTKPLQEYKIDKISAYRSKNLSFFILDNLEVKIGEDIKDKLKIFSSLLPHIASELHRIRYIDLRFKEPVIKYEK